MQLVLNGYKIPEGFKSKDISGKYLKIFVKAGIPAYETLQSATVLPAKALGTEKQTGTIEKGKKANIIILEKNPLENITNIRSLQWTYSNGFLVSGLDD